MAMAIRNFEGYVKDNVSAGLIDPREIQQALEVKP